MNATADQTLFQAGYSAAPDATLHCIRVVKPNGEAYRVNLMQRTCTCMGFVSHGHCKHVRQAIDLVNSCWCAVPHGLTMDEHRRHEDAMFSLLCILDDVRDDRTRYGRKAA